MTRHRAFTLIEALVIVAIIGLLAAIILPQFAKSGERAREQRCQSNLKTIGIGLRLYTQDNNQFMPITSGTYITDFMRPSSLTNPLRALDPYITNSQVYICPNAQPRTNSSGPNFNGETSYTGNQVVMPLRALKVAAISHPGSVIVMQESGLRSRTFYSFPNVRSREPDSVCAFWHAFERGTENLSNIHFDGGNLLFVDGHVKWRPFKSLRSGDFGLKPDQPWTETNGENPDGGGQYHANL